MLNKSQQRFLTLSNHLFPLVQCDEIALKFAKNGANVLKARMKSRVNNKLFLISKHAAT